MTIRISRGFSTCGLMAILMCWFALLPTAASAQIQYTNSTDGPVNETATPCANPLLRSFSVTDAYTVADVDIGVLMRHSYRGDLLMYLNSPSSTRIQLFTGTGGTRNNFNVLLDDSNANSVTTHFANDTANAATIVPPYQRNFAPANSLLPFNGENALGTWVLEICDRFNLDSGTFYQSDLFLTAEPATINVTKISSTISDGVSASNPKSIPGAVVRYCITITNAGPGIAATINASDAMPANANFVAGSMRSGANCGSAGTIEDDNNIGSDENDPVGAAFSASTLTIINAALASGGSFAVTFTATIN